jgi:MORN repeat.
MQTLQRNGIGTEVFHDGSKYKGCYFEDFKHGFGRMI